VNKVVSPGKNHYTYPYEEQGLAHFVEHLVLTARPGSRRNFRSSLGKKEYHDMNTELFNFDREGDPFRLQFLKDVSQGWAATRDTTISINYTKKTVILSDWEIGQHLVEFFDTNEIQNDYEFQFSQIESINNALKGIYDPVDINTRSEREKEFFHKLNQDNLKGLFLLLLAFYNDKQEDQGYRFTGDLKKYLADNKIHIIFNHWPSINKFCIVIPSV
jgi:hypothetical protein